MSNIVLVRYGSVPEVARFVNRAGLELDRGDPVVIQTHRGLQLGEALETIARSAELPAAADIEFEVVRAATDEDRGRFRELQARCESEFYDWCRRIILWNLNLELIDIERTLDGEKVILYVLTERGPATTTLALQAAAAGLGIVEVQPVSAAGLVAVPVSGGGCGSGGCGCSH